MANPNKFTAKEVLNKVLLDSSGNAVTANSVTSQEALNSVLDTTNNRLNMSLAGGTISGDVTISGDLTVNGSATNSYDEIVNGQLVAFRDDSSTVGTNDNIVIENDGTGDASLKFSLTGATDWFAYVDNSDSDKFKIRRSTSDYLEIDESGNVAFSGDILVANATPSLSLQDTDGTNQISEFLTSGATTYLSLRNGSSHGSLVIRGYNGSAYSTALTIGSDQSATFSSNVTIGSGGTTPDLTFNEGDSSIIGPLNANFLIKSRGNGADEGVSIQGADGVGLLINKAGSATFGGDVSLNSALTLGVGGSTNGKINTPESMYFNIDSDNSQTDTEFVFGKNRSSDSGGSELMRLTESGMLGINDNNPSHPLSVNGAVTVYGQNTVHDVSAMVLGQESSSKSQIRVYGADGTTEGSLEIVTSASDGVPTTTVMLLDSNSVISLSNNDGGNTGNTIFGHTAWQQSSNVGADYNTIFGQEAMGSGNIGAAERNTGIGFAVMKNITTGDSNVAVGSDTFFNITEGSENVAVGRDAGLDLTTGSESVLIGSRAGYNLTTTNGNIAIGRYSLYNSTSAVDCIVIGRQAMMSGSATQTGTVAIGKNSLTNLSTGAYNTAVGHQSLLSETAGGYSTAIGYEALENQNGVSGVVANTALGYYAGNAITTGIKNTMLGAYAGYLSLLPDNCTLVGYNAGGSGVMTADADATTAIGMNSLGNLTSGAGNVGVGYSALGNCTTGKRNTAVGYEVMHSAMNVGDNNTAMGYQSLYSLNPDTDDHGSNTAVGKQSGYDVSTGTGNVLVGANAGNSGSNDLTTGDNNTYIGNEATGSASSAVNQTVIGALATGQQNNSVTLGNASVTDVFMGQDSGAIVACSAISFPGTQVPSGGANALDDYEEGAWTPILSDGTNNFTMASNQNGRYTKIGRVVHFEAECGTSSIGSASGNLKLIGLPFTSASSTSEGSCSIGFLRSFNYSSSTFQLLAQVNGGTTEIAFTLTKDDTTEEFVQCSAADSSSFFIRVSGTYFV